MRLFHSPHRSPVRQRAILSQRRRFAFFVHVEIQRTLQLTRISVAAYRYLSKRVKIYIQQFHRDPIYSFFIHIFQTMSSRWISPLRSVIILLNYTYRKTRGFAPREIPQPQICASANSCNRQHRKKFARVALARW